MQVFTATLTPDWLKAMAEPLGIQLYGFTELTPHSRGPQKDKRRYSFLLRPMTGHPNAEDFRANSGRRRLWAIDWEGHYAFMERMFRADQEAQLRSTLATYDGLHSFRQTAGASRNRYDRWPVGA